MRIYGYFQRRPCITDNSHYLSNYDLYRLLGRTNNEVERAKVNTYIDRSFKIKLYTSKYTSEQFVSFRRNFEGYEADDRI